MAVIKANKYNVLIAFFVALGSFTYGYNSSVTAGVVGLPSFFAYMKIDTSTSQGNALFGGKLWHIFFTTTFLSITRIL